MKYINIEVKPEDIEDAGRGSYNCPVAQSLRREHHGAFVQVYGDSITVGNKCYVPSKNLKSTIFVYDTVHKFTPGTYRAYEHQEHKYEI